MTKNYFTKSTFGLSTCVLLIPLTGLTHESRVIEEVNVFGRKANLIGDAISASEGRVSQEDLAIQPMLRSGDVLEIVPGMVATQHSGSGKANQYFLRGFNLDHGTDFATFVDSMPVNMRSHGHGHGYTDLNFIIPELISEVEYKKGSYYADVGDFSGTGSAKLHTLSKLNTHKISLSMGENGFARALVYGGAESDMGHTTYGFEKHVYDGPWDDLNEDVDKTNVSLKHSWGSNGSVFKLNAMAYDNAWNSADQIPERAITQGIVSELGSLDTTLGGQSSRYSLSFGWDKSEADRRITANAYAIQYDMDLWSNFTYFTAPEGDQFQQVDERYIYGGDVSYSLGGHLMDHDMKNTIGLEARMDDISELGLYRTANRQKIGVVRSDSINQYSVSGYWENLIQWNYQFRSVLGLRYDYFNFDVKALSAAEAITIEPNSGTANDGITTASISLIYTFNDHYETYASIGQGFHSNDARGTTISLDPNTAEPVEPVDPLVGTLGYELGLRAFITDKINASVALWKLDIDSELLFVGDQGSTEDTGVGSNRKGLEATAYYSFNEYLTFDIEYAFTHARLNNAIDGSDTIPGALESVYSTGIHTQFSESFYSHLSLRHFGSYPLDGGETAAASTLANMRIGYSFNENLSLTFDALNIFDSNDHDVEYYYESQLENELEPVGDHHYHVFEPRTFRVYANYTF